MPWQETLLMDQRVQFIADYQRDVFDVTELARRYGISRKTAYKWIARYDVGGPAGLVDRSRRPAQCPHSTPPPIIAALLDVRRHHPTWGAKKLRKVLGTRNEMLKRLQRLGLEPEQITGILVTHEHDDHAKGAF